MYGDAPYTVIRRAVHIHPTVARVDPHYHEPMHDWLERALRVAAPVGNEQVEEAGAVVVAPGRGGALAAIADSGCRSRRCPSRPTPARCRGSRW